MGVACYTDVEPHHQPAQAAPLVVDDSVADLGTSPRIRLWPAASPPQTRPVALIDCQTPLCHVIHFMDEESPRFEDKPAEVASVEIWVNIGVLPAAADDDLTMLALDTHSPYLARYAEAQAGQHAHYRLRWVNVSGEKGPWSQTFTAPIKG